MDATATWARLGRHVDHEGERIWMADLEAIGPERHRPLLVLHGFPTCAVDWRACLPLLREHRRVVLFDFPGFGLSDKPDRRYSIGRYADAAEVVAAAAHLDEIDLLTHDMGDTVGGELLARDLDGGLRLAVARRVLTNGSIYLELAQLTEGQKLLLSLPDERVDLAAAGVDASANFGAGIAQTFSADHQPDAEELALQWALMSHQDGHTLLPRTIRYIEDRRAHESRFTGAIEAHPSPLGVVWGCEDPVAVSAMVDRLLAARPGTPTVLLEDVGHYPMIEAPERFAGAVLSLLDQLE